MHPAEIITKAAYGRGLLTGEELAEVATFSTVQQYALLSCLYVKSPEEFQALARTYPYFDSLSDGQSCYRELIQAKLDGRKLQPEEIARMIDAYCTRPADFPAPFMASFLAGIFVNGMDSEETAALTEAMTASGKVLSFPEGKSYVDKHSTGGIGDKVSLVLSPLIVSTFPGIANPMMSGRGLGHTGGTLDKLEAIPGFTTELSEQRVREIVDRCGACIFAQLPTVAVADKGMYAIRDVTGLIVNTERPTFALIIGSILSKKFAEGCNRFVFDVKIGSGGFFPEIDQGRAFTREMVAACRGRFKAAALLTNMDQPLGSAVGNALEVIESVYTLMGQGPRDLTELALQQCVEMARLHDSRISREEAYRLLDGSLRNGKALERFKQMVELQGGDRGYIDEIERLWHEGVTIYQPRPYPLLDRMKVAQVPAPRDGVLTTIDARAIGFIGIDLGAGRKKVGDPLDYQVGFVQKARLGQTLRKGDPLAHIFLPAGIDEDAFIQSYQTVHRIEDGAADPVGPLIYERVGD